jgi:uncharacterized protein with HEPN domain
MRRDLAYLRDIQESARLAISYLEGACLESFSGDTQLQDAVIRRIEIIGEAARRVSEETRAEQPALPWRQMIGIRNQVIHMYDGVDISVVWSTVRDDLPGLLETLDGILGREEP